ncbi:aminotransferase class I/II-fold pyridoxal phosphate-dependent enzyme [Alkalicoccobacillus murimartini]|uniref:Lysine decarboxylase n=1 Tax=Alkalicoccobacillus murimartini TaxID=171685 RepID=A0ABT9YMR8_9BACI|nr:aminotransferase class I/II-fold pyridoxal phosphate-dependent enzyme [Alkalicoccobacillus murimartini]MDQ0209150.1 lysine decarboxylase [Alkalicoccobacillus murimartini]
MKDDIINVPLVRALKEHMETKPESFHVPGHKNGKIIPNGLDSFKEIFPYDMTEIEGLDDLHDPSGAIKEAQRLLAEYYGSLKSYFLVGGSTVGNLAMVYALCKPGDVVLVQRNSHKSILHAVELAGVKAVYLTSERDEESGHVVGLTEEILTEALNDYPQATALIMTYPNYYGVSRHPGKIIRAAKEAGLLVLVDEAHGAHFVLGDPFPVSTVNEGADIVVQSAHKTLPALTMGSYLHVSEHLHQGQLEDVERALSMFQSSSPSYLIMASLDAARGYLESYTNECLTTTMVSIQFFKKGLNAIPQLEVVEWDKGGYQYDPLKVTIKSTSSLTGFQLQELLHREGIDAEMADERHILLVMGLEPLDNCEDVLKTFTRVLAPYVSNHDDATKKEKVTVPSSSSEEYNKNIHSLKKERVPFKEAEGRVSAEAVTPYPPGIPLLYPGQRISKEVLQQIEHLQQAGARFQGTDVVKIGIYVVNLED